MTDVVPLEPGESVEWAGRPRLTTVLPSAGLGIALLLAGGAFLAWPALLVESGRSATVRSVVRIGGTLLVLVGITVPIWTYLRVTNTRFLVSDRALYRKTGVVSRSVRRVELQRVQDSSFSQPVRGRLFGWGTATFEVAGGGTVRFDRIDDPKEVRRLVDRVSDSEEVPGSLDQWKQVREEVRALRQALER